MITLNATDYIKEMLRNGASEQEVAEHFTDILNQTFKSYNKEKRVAAMDEEMAHVVDQINLCLENYCELHGIKDQSYDIFTEEDLEEAFKAKIYGSEKDKDCKCDCKCAQKGEANVKVPEISGHVTIKDMNTGKVDEYDLTEKDFQDAYSNLLNELYDLFSK